MSRLSSTYTTASTITTGGQVSVIDRIANLFRNIGQPKTAPSPLPTMPGDVYDRSRPQPTTPGSVAPNGPVAPLPPPVLPPAAPVVAPVAPPPPPPVAPMPAAPPAGPWKTPGLPSGVYPSPIQPGQPPVPYPAPFPAQPPMGYPAPYPPSMPVPGPGGIPGTIPYGVSPVAAVVGVVAGLISLFRRPPKPDTPASPAIPNRPNVPLAPPTDWSIDLAPDIRGRTPRNPNTTPPVAARPAPSFDQDALTWKDGNGFARNQQLGKAMLQNGELHKQLKEFGAEQGMPPGALEQWATAHPGLAYKRLQELKRRASLA